MKEFRWRAEPVPESAFGKWLRRATVVLAVGVVVVLFSAILDSCVMPKPCPSTPEQEDEIPDQIDC